MAQFFIVEQWGCLVQNGALYEGAMARPRGHKDSVRLSVSLESQDHSVISRMAADLNLSAAWLVRRAVSEFVSRYEESAQAELPLAPSSDKSSH